jgi:hypothetical protein
MFKYEPRTVILHYYKKFWKLSLIFCFIVLVDNNTFCEYWVAQL